jgi:hypothetical protein
MILYLRRELLIFPILNISKNISLIFVNLNTIFLFEYLKELIVAHALIKDTGVKIKSGPPFSLIYYK